MVIGWTSEGLDSASAVKCLSNEQRHISIIIEVQGNFIYPEGEKTENKQQHHQQCDMTASHLLG